jgi:putative FmdB family regulatory protein
MPLYEYHCATCEVTFEVLVRSDSPEARCPECGNPEVRREFSVPAAAQAGGPRASDLPVCGPAGAEAFGCGGGRCMTGLCDN